MKSRAAIFDIDGTIACGKHREHMLKEDPTAWQNFLDAKDMESARWTRFFNAAHADTPKPHAVKMARLLAAEAVDILLVTGRSEPYRAATMTWLAEHKVPFDLLFMRGADDRRHDTVVKRELYEREIAPHWNVELVLEDRARVVTMWRELGLECWQVAEGAF